MKYVAAGLSTILTTFAFLAVVSAHPGHGDPHHSDGVVHYVAHPVHSGWGLMTLAAGVAGILVWRAHHHRTIARKVRCDEGNSPKSR
ncbi:MAG: hypothetical protein KDA85_03390 [Planctomycetaceae bacterium]|nr:hypothetical protein [Planctomycetaceae bacterium]